MRLVFLGVGGWISRPVLGHTSVLMEVSGERLLLDAGEGVSKAIYLYGGGFKGLRGIVVTHLHGDHVLGLPTLLMLLKYTGSNRVTVYTPLESVENLRTLLKITGVDYEAVADIAGVAPGSIHVAGPFKLKFARATHPVPSVSVRVEAEGKCVTYSGDTSYSIDLVELARNCNVLVHEASGHDPVAHVYGHSTVEDAVRTAVEAGVENLVLAHYYMDVPHINTRAGALGLKLYVSYPGFELEL